MRKEIIGIMVVMMLLVPTASASFLDSVDKQIDNVIVKAKLSLTGYSTNVPITTGYPKIQGNYWVLSYDVGSRKDEAVMTLAQGTTLPLTGVTALKTGEEVTVFFDPSTTYAEAGLTKNNLYFAKNSWNWGYCYDTGWTCTVAPAYDVSPTWQGTATYLYGMYVGSMSGFKNVEGKQSYDQPVHIDLGGGAWIENTGWKSNGANIPSGNFRVVLDPWNKPHLFKSGSSGIGTYQPATIEDSITWWQNNKPWSAYYSSFTWTDIWNYLANNNKLPPDYLPYGYVPTYTYNSAKGDYDKVRVQFPDNSIIPTLVIYIPQSLAKTVTIQVGGSKATILSASKLSTTAGQYATANIVVRNDGSADYVTVSARSNYYTFNTQQKYMQAGETATFTLQAQALGGVNAVGAYTALADGTAPQGGDSTMDGVAEVYGLGGDNKAALLTVKPIDEKGATVGNAPIYINGVFKFKGQGSVSLQKGTYTVTSDNTDGLFAQKATDVIMNGADQTITFRFTKEPKGDDYTWIFWGLIAIIIVIVFMRLGIAQAILKHPALLFVLVVVLFILYFLWQLFNVAMGVVDNVNTAYQNTVALLPWNW